MPEGKYLGALKEAIVSLDFSAIVEAAKKAMEAGVDPRVAITEGMVPGMVVVGEKFESGEYFLSELVVAGEVMKDGMKIIDPYIKGDISTAVERAVICTVEGDYHDIGKNIVITLLGVQGCSCGEGRERGEGAQAGHSRSVGVADDDHAENGRGD